MRFLNSSNLLGLLIALSLSLWAQGQTPRYPDFTGPQSDVVRRAEAIRSIGELAVRDLSTLPESLPQLVEALNDESKEVRFAAAKAIGSSAVKLDRIRFSRRSFPKWEDLAPLYRNASARLDSIGTYSRIQRQIDAFIDRNEQLHLAGTQTLSPGLPRTNQRAINKETQQFLDDFFRIEEDQLVEMWRYANRHLPALSSADRQRALEELVTTAPPRWFEFMLLLSDNYDDDVLSAVLMQDQKEFDANQAFLLTIATPQREAVRRALASVACNSARSEEDRLLALASLAQSPMCEPQILSQIIRFSLQQRSPTRLTELFAPPH